MDNSCLDVAPQCYCIIPFAEVSFSNGDAGDVAAGSAQAQLWVCLVVAARASCDVLVGPFALCALLSPIRRGPFRASLAATAAAGLVNRARARQVRTSGINLSIYCFCAAQYCWLTLF
jgi:hypothetical protein